MTELTHEIESLEDLKERGHDLRSCAIQGLDLRAWEVDWAQFDVRGTVFLGCRFRGASDESDLVRRGAVLFPALPDLPYNPYRHSLYSWQELLEGWSPDRDDSRDLAIYRHFQQKGGHLPGLMEALAQRVHDHAVDNALRAFLDFDGNGLPRRRAVGIMGGHGLRRDTTMFGEVAHTARMLTESGYLVVTGGGPGVMEAGNLGAYLSGRGPQIVDEAIEHLAASPAYTSKGYVGKALEVVEQHPTGEQSLAIPTWFYGHEPSNLFATSIAKYFSNSIREDGLLAICMHGVVFAPGSAGTTQEIFMDAVQNHYVSLGFISPMVFLGRERYSQETGLYALVERLAEGKAYADYLLLADHSEEVLEFISRHPPLKVSS